MSRPFLFLYDFFSGRKVLLYLIFAVTLVLFGWLAAGVKFEERISQMLPESSDTKNLVEFMDDSRFSDQIMVAVSSIDTSGSETNRLIEMADSLVVGFNVFFADDISDITYKTDDEEFSNLFDIVINNFPVFLNEADYLAIDSLSTPESVNSTVQNAYRTIQTPAGFFTRKFITSDPLGISLLILKKFEAFRGDASINIYNNHFISNDGRYAVLYFRTTHKSGETEANAAFFEQFNNYIEKFKDNNPGIAVHYFGAPAVAAGNSARIRTDSLLTITITVVALLLLFLFFFRNPLSPLQIMIPVIYGGAFALAAINIISGHISAIAVGAGSLILGIAVNYSLHFLTHFKLHGGIRETIKVLSLPMTAGSLTTIGGFLCLQFVNAPVLQDLGLFAAFSLTGAAIGSLVFLPHFINNKNSASGHINNDIKPGVLTKFLHNNRSRLALLFFIITPVFLWFAPGVQFETDMYRVNYMDDQLRESESVIKKFTGYFDKSVYMISSGNNLDDALSNCEEYTGTIDSLLDAGTVTGYINSTGILPPVKEQEKRLEKWKKYWSEKKTAEVQNSLNTSGVAAGFRMGAFDGFTNQVSQTYSELDASAVQFIQEKILSNFIDSANGRVRITNIIKTTPENTATLYADLSANNNTWFLDRQQVTDKLVSLVNREFNFITLWTSLLVFIALLIIYGRIELALISFIPMVMTWIWILGIMSLAGITFNVINIILSTLIFALGDDFCIYTTDNLQQQYIRRERGPGSSSVSIGLSATATILGMGVLIFASHPALKSIALVSIIGITSVWMMSQVIQPYLFNLLITKPTEKKHQPYTFSGILKSAFAFGYFITGSLFVSLFGMIVFRILRIKSKLIKYYYHVIISKYARSIVYIMPNVHKEIFNPGNESFSKPAVIIANHSSFLDILLMIMLHPKVILLTNDWVWHSPIFGRVVQIADYYPVSEGAENTIDPLRKKVSEGYSIVVFPEGTRSADGIMGRFHKGAFYLAENLQLDILPVLIHGAQYTMTKNFFYLKDGFLNIKILPRIKNNDPEYGDNIRDRTKNISRYFKDEFKKFKSEREDTTYFKKQIFNNYLFKGPVLEWYMKVKMKLEKNYKVFNELIPDNARVTDIGCGYGFMSYMLSLTGPERKVTGVDYDEEKITIAQNGYLRGENLHFENASAENYEPEESDAFILADVLHYLTPESQVAVIKKCIRKLADGGTMVIRDGVSELKERHRGTKLSELFSTRITGFNKTGSKGLSFISSKMIYDIASETGMTITEIDETKLTSNIIFVLKK